MDAALAKKLNIKAEESLRLVNAPTEHRQLFSTVADASQFISDGTADLVILFVTHQAELSTLLPGALSAVKPGGRFWVAFPKKTSGIKSDISRDKGWDPVIAAGLNGVMLIAIDDRWTASRLRHVSEIKNITRIAPVSKDQRPELIVPSDLAALLAENPDAKTHFHSLAYTHRKEYIRWIEDAKKPETRAKRVAKGVEMILEKKKLS